MDKRILSELIITNVCSANRIHSVTGTVTQRVNRGCWAVAIKPNGQTEYICNGEKVFSDGRNAVILAKGANYSWKSLGGECHIIDFDAELSMNKIFGFKIKDCTKIVSLFNKVENSMLSSKSCGKLQSIETLYSILLTLLDSRESYITSKKEAIIKPVIDFISEHYSDPKITNAHLSEIAGVSTVYFRKIFTEAYNCPPMEYLYKLRMNKAVEMLKSDHNSITGIAESVGYNSIYNFSKMFRQYYGVSPSQYK